jgi:isopenicillin N synthase-like dioxygenase
MTSIPVVDFEGVSSTLELSSCPQVEQIHSAFSTVGFVFIKNHGIPRKLVREM